MAHKGKTLGKFLGKSLGIPIEVDLCREYLDKRLLIHACDIERYILYNGVYTGPFAANEPAWRYVNIPGYGSVPLLQVERESTNTEEYSESTWNVTRANITDNTENFLHGEQTADFMYEDSTPGSTHYFRRTFTVSGIGEIYSGSLFIKPGTRDKFRIDWQTSCFRSSCNLDADLDAGSLLDAGSDLLSYKFEQIGDWFWCSSTAETDDTGTGRWDGFLLDDVGSDTYDGDGSSGLTLCARQIERLPWSSSYIRTDGSTETRPIVTAQINAANVPGWMKSRFIIPWIPYGGSTQFSTTDHILCEMRDSAEDWTLYFKGSTGEVILTGSVTGDILTKSAITFSALGDPVLFDFTLNNGSVASLTVSGADTGDGTQAASQAISFDGNFHVGTDHTGGNEADGLVWVIKP